MTPETIQIFADLSQAFAVIVGVFIAVKGINAWRDEMVGRRKAELAEEILAAFYEARDVIKWARFPGGYKGEGETRPPIDGETEEQAQARNTHYIPVESLNQNKELFSKIQSHKYRFMAYFGEEAEKSFADMKSIHSQILVAAGSLIRTEHYLWTTGEIPSSVMSSRQKSESITGAFLGSGPINKFPLSDQV